MVISSACSIDGKEHWQPIASIENIDMKSNARRTFFPSLRRTLAGIALDSDF